MLTVADVGRKLVHCELLLLRLEAKGGRFCWCRHWEIVFAAVVVIGNWIAVVVETVAVHFPAAHAVCKSCFEHARVNGFKLTLLAKSAYRLGQSSACS